MGKDNFLTPKAIANRIKAKGLQKLRWYCQLCQKQCRDENGFKCHQTSESHRRQFELFGHAPGRFISDYSRQFQEDFLYHLRMSHPFSRVAATVVYNEFIANRNHVHMNSTRWLTLTEFVKYLGREGICKVEETPKGWFITLIQKDPMEKIDEEKKLRRAQHEREEEERQLAALRAQVARARRQAGDLHGDGSDDEGEGNKGGELARGEDAAPVVVQLAPMTRMAASAPGEAGGRGLGPGRPPRAPAPRPVVPVADAFGGDDEEATVAVHSGAKRSKMDEVMKKEMESRAVKARLDHWLVPGIVVKVMSAALKEHGYYKQKGLVQKVIDKYVGELKMLDSEDIIRVDQEELETVIPSPGGAVLVVNGMHRGTKGSVVRVEVEEFRTYVKLTDGPYKGTEVALEYEDVCKLHVT